MQYSYTSPGGEYYNTLDYLLNTTHLLIAGATGSGKSNMINGIMQTALTKYTPAQHNFLLIDPKYVELSAYRGLGSWVWGYCREYNDIIAALDGVINEMMNRYRQLDQRGLKMWDGVHLHVVIDEYADLVLQGKKEVETRIQRIAQLGRAAGIHLIVATQRPTTDVVNGSIKTNIDQRIALHTASAQDSRNIIGQKGAELLPKYGMGYYYGPSGVELIEIPKADDDRIAELIRYWKNDGIKVYEDPKAAAYKQKLIERMRTKKNRTA